jgi:site-specific DNA recombinase
LRDAICGGAVLTVAVLSLDRLARNYQVLLLEENGRRIPCSTRRLCGGFSAPSNLRGPNDQFLLQIQGEIAEYKRAVLAERFRRGKLQKPHADQVLAGRAPYGYRYVHQHEESLGHPVVDEAEANPVRALYTWLTEEWMTMRQILKCLNFGPWMPRLTAARTMLAFAGGASSSGARKQQKPWEA